VALQRSLDPQSSKAQRAEGTKIFCPSLPVFVPLGLQISRVEERSIDLPCQVASLAHVRSYDRRLQKRLQGSTFCQSADIKLLAAEESVAPNALVCINLLASRLALRLFHNDVAGSGLFGRRKAIAAPSADRHLRILRAVLDQTNLTLDPPSKPARAFAAALVI